MSRTALLLRMTRDEAEKVRSEAAKRGDKINTYVLRAAMHAAVDDGLFSRIDGCWSGELPRPIRPSSGPKTALLIRCTAEEAAKIREAASRSEMTIVGFLRHSLRTSWEAEKKRTETAEGEVVMAPRVAK